MQLFPLTTKIKRFIDDRLMETRLRQIIYQFEDQSLNPPGGDLVIQACYKATLDILRENKLLKKLVEDVLRQRLDLNEFHFVNLFFRTLQYMRLFVDKNAPQYSENSRSLKKDWLRYIKKLISSHKKQLLKHLLLTKDTATTKYQRYVSLLAIINWFFPSQGVKIGDFGCGGNYGLKGIELGEKFDPVKDKTAKKIFTKLLSSDIHLAEGLGIDKEDPDGSQGRNWRLACSFYPKELAKLNVVLEFEQRIKQSRKVKFLKADLTEVEVKPVKSLQSNHQKALPKSYFDIVAIYTTLYQIHDVAKQMEILEKAKSCLKKHGLLVVQDFVQRRDDNSLDFSIAWFDKPFSSYKTLITSADFNWRFLEIFSWENGRCQKVKDGEDLPILLKGYFANTPKAALAHSTS